MQHTEQLLIVGASVRAAAFSALRAGLRPECADLFADADLQARCAVRCVAAMDYPRGFLDLPSLSLPGPWLYTGGLENRPDLIAEMARRRQPLWGNSADVLRRVRSPFAVAGVLRRAGLPCPALWPSDTLPPATGRWLVKPLDGAGGSGIHLWDGTAPRSRPRRRCYYQEFLEGGSYSGIYLGNSHAARLLGVTRQLVGEPWLHARPFHYCGSIGPVALGKKLEQGVAGVGSALAQGFGLKGLFGVDFILSGGIPYPVEVNPRTTASVEVIEYATGLLALALHGQVFDPDVPVPPASAGSAGVVGKAILFARAPLRFPDRGPWRAWIDTSAGASILATYADIPHPGDLIEAGQPIMTVFARAGTVEDCQDRLQLLASDLDRRLFGR